MKLGETALSIKERNTDLIRKVMKSEIRSTKQDLARITGLSGVTVGSILRQLEKNEEIFQGPLVASNGGRPARLFRFNENHTHILALFTRERDGKDFLCIKVFNLFKECLYGCETELAEVVPGVFDTAVDGMLGRYPRIRAIAMGLPGVESNGKVVVSDHAKLADTDFLERCRKKYQLPLVFENDVNASAVGYCKRKNIESEAAVLYFYFPEKYPPGAGIVIGNRLYKGKNNLAGEIKHVPSTVDWSDPQLYSDCEKVCEAIIRLLVAAVALLAPVGVALHGAFLGTEHRRIIERGCSLLAPAGVMPDIRGIEDFLGDYQEGLVEETLRFLEKSKER